MNKNFIVFIFYSLLVNSLQYDSNNTCNNFMVLMAGKSPWIQEESETALRVSFLKLSDRLRLLSYQMKQMNSNLSIFITEPLSKLPKDNANYSNIEIRPFNSRELLHEYGFDNKILNKMKQWKVNSYTRASDIIRILLAHKYKMTYIDTDIQNTELK